MSRGIRKDSTYRISSTGLTGWDNLVENDAERYVCDISAYEFAKQFGPTDTSDVNLNSTSSVMFDYSTGDYTAVGYIDIQGSLTFDMNPYQDEIELITGISVRHGGFDKTEIGYICQDIHEEGKDAVKDLVAVKDALELK